MNECKCCRKPFKKWDYVLATKFSDGNPGDHFYVGFYDESYTTNRGEIRHMITDNEGNQARGNGFCRVKHIIAKRGNWIVSHAKLIEQSNYSVWHWYRAPWKLLEEFDNWDVPIESSGTGCG